MQGIAPAQLRNALERLEELTASAYIEAAITQGEVTEALAQLETWIEEAGAQALELLCWSIRESAATKAAVNEEVQRLAGIRVRSDRRTDWAKAKIIELLDRKGDRSTQAGTFAIHTRKNSGKAITTGATSPTELPPDLRRVSITPNLTEILKRLRSGVEVEGYGIGPETRSVVIR